MGEGSHLQVQLPGVPFQFRVGERQSSLALEKLVMVWPELLLLSGALSGLGGSDGMLPQNGEVLVREPHLAILEIGLFEPWKRLGPELPAEATLEV